MPNIPILRSLPKLGYRNSKLHLCREMTCRMEAESLHNPPQVRAGLRKRMSQRILCTAPSAMVSGLGRQLETNDPAVQSFSATKEPT